MFKLWYSPGKMCWKTSMGKCLTPCIDAALRVLTGDGMIKHRVRIS